MFQKRTQGAKCAEPRPSASKTKDDAVIWGLPITPLLKRGRDELISHQLPVCYRVSGSGLKRVIASSMPATSGQRLLRQSADGILYSFARLEPQLRQTIRVVHAQD